MKRILITLLFSVCTLLPAAVRTLFPSEKDWRLTGAERKDGMVCIVNRSAGDYHSMGLWMKLRKGQKLTFKVVLRGENIAGKKKPYRRPSCRIRPRNPLFPLGTRGREVDGIWSQS